MPLSVDGGYAGIEQTRIGYNTGTDSVSNVRDNAYTASRSDGLSQGQTVTGQIVDKDGDQVTIRLENDRTISAKLAGNADIEVGMKLTFEVAKSGGQTALRPLFSNLSGSNAAMSALRAAGLPVNNTTLAMTDRMMSESMPVNRNALAQMFRNVSAHPNVSPESIVQMTKLNMPLTESNVIQFDNYRNFEHQITDDLQNVSYGVADLLEEAVNLAGTQEGINISQFGGMTAGEVINEVLNLIDTDSLETIMPQSVAGGEVPQVTEEALPDSPAADSGKEAVVISGREPAVQDMPSQDISPDIAQTEQGSAAESVTGEAAFNTNLSLTAAEQQMLVDDLQGLLILAGESADIHEPLDPSAVITAVKELVQEYPPDDIKVEETEFAAYSEESNEANEEGKLQNAARSDISTLKPLSPDNPQAGTPVQNTEESAKTVKAQIHEKLNSLLKSDGFSKLIKDSVKSQMSIRPEDVAKQGKIEELYERIQKSSGKISQLMENIGRPDSPVAAAAQGLNDNVNFMNQLNEFVNYVQLPLKMAGEDANGELYVYTNKKNLANNDGNFSALLHLDMEHLGPMDVYVKMRDYTKVSTNFYLENEEMLDFIEAHIDELTERLTQKGYNTTTKVTQKEPGKPITPIADEFTKEEATGEVRPATVRMRFDVRA